MMILDNVKDMVEDMSTTTKVLGLVSLGTLAAFGISLYKDNKEVKEIEMIAEEIEDCEIIDPTATI